MTETYTNHGSIIQKTNEFRWVRRKDGSGYLQQMHLVRHDGDHSEADFVWCDIPIVDEESLGKGPS